MIWVVLILIVVDAFFNKVNIRPCEIVRLKERSGFDVSVMNITECLNWCETITNCMGIMHSHNNTCIRSSYLELTDLDHKTNFNLTVYYRGKIPYYSGMCNSYAPSFRCNMFKKCRWNRGPRGYNDELSGDSRAGWCGRIKC